MGEVFSLIINKIPVAKLYNENCFLKNAYYHTHQTLFQTQGFHWDTWGRMQ